jgi:hypothetical protein
MLDTTDYTARLIYFDTKAGNSSGSVYLSDADGNVPFVFVSPGPDNASDDLLVASITASGTLSWEPVYDQFGSTLLSGQTIIFVYVIDEKVC